MGGTGIRLLEPGLSGGCIPGLQAGTLVLDVSMAMKGEVSLWHSFHTARAGPILRAPWLTHGWRPEEPHPCFHSGLTCSGRSSLRKGTWLGTSALEAQQGC